MKGKPTGCWAKYSRDEATNEIVAWHPLISHSADVAVCLEALLTETILGRRLAHLLGWTELENPHVHRLCVLAAIHDAGKVNHGFQARTSLKASRVGHVVPMVDVLASDSPEKGRILEALHVREMVPWFSDEEYLCTMLLAAWGHHGRPVRFRYHRLDPTMWNPSANGYDPIAEIQELASAAFEWFPQAQEQVRPFSRSPEFQHAFNGVLTLADWIGSDAERFFPYEDDTTDYLEDARKGARRAINAFGLNAEPARENLGTDAPGFEEFSPFSPYPVQERVLELPTNAEGSLTIVESDTGSGKTEAAIARFLHLFHAGVVDGMYFALPTRAAATQIFERVREAIDTTFGSAPETPPAVLALPGYLAVDDQRGQRLAPFDVQWPDEVWSQRGWAAEGPKRYLASAIAVGTIDQVLMSTLQVKHAHMRSAALLRHFLVVDEVHASDPYMSSLLESVLEHHLGAGGHALLMSATLGSSSRTRFLYGKDRPLPPLSTTEDDPYPLIAHRDAQGAECLVESAEASGYTKTVGVESVGIAGDVDAIARLAVAAAEQGARVLIIRNLVRDCMATQQAVENAASSQILLTVNGVVTPHHSRYAAQDRKLLDRAVEANLGKGSTRNGVIAVATQTVEQSLDIDADLLITDLCPVDVLLQRIGRLHRHEKRDRPEGFEGGKVWVLEPEVYEPGQWIASEGWGKGPHGFGPVYADLRVLEATRRLVQKHPEWTIPDMNRMLVEHATHPDALNPIAEELEGPWKRHRRRIEGVRLADRAHADLCMLSRDKLFAEELFPANLDERISTRLGASDRRIEFDEPVQSPFGARIWDLNIPDWMTKGVPNDMESTSPRPVNGGFVFELAHLKFEYNRFGLHNLQDE